jgi:hypothetical protein
MELLIHPTRPLSPSHLPTAPNTPGARAGKTAASTIEGRILYASGTQGVLRRVGEVVKVKVKVKVKR